MERTFVSLSGFVCVATLRIVGLINCTCFQTRVTDCSNCSVWHYTKLEHVGINILAVAFVCLRVYPACPICLLLLLFFWFCFVCLFVCFLSACSVYLLLLFLHVFVLPVLSVFCCCFFVFVLFLFFCCCCCCCLGGLLLFCLFVFACLFYLSSICSFACLFVGILRSCRYCIRARIHQTKYNNYFILAPAQLSSCTLWIVSLQFVPNKTMPLHQLVIHLRDKRRDIRMEKTFIFGHCPVWREREEREGGGREGGETDRKRTLKK